MISSNDSSSPVKERSGLSLSAMKSFVVGEKEDKFASEFGRDEKVMSFIDSLLDPGKFLICLLGTRISLQDNCHYKSENVIRNKRVSLK